MFKLKKKEQNLKNTEKELLSLQQIVAETGEHFHGILRANLYEMNLKKEQLQNLMYRKTELRMQLKNCGIGNAAAKEYVKEIIKEMLIEKYHINENNMEQLYPFSKKDRLKIEQKFEILLYEYKKKYDKKAIEHLIEDHKLLEGQSEKYEITETMISQIYEQTLPVLHYLDKLEIITQKIYQLYKGLGVVDEIRDMHIDGVSGGVSGMERQEKSVWIFYKGKSVYLSFLAFESKHELERICRNICRYEQPGQLSETKGYIVNEMADNSRIVVARPPFCENWVFFVRKFDNLEHKNIEQLLTDQNPHIPITLLKWIIKGCQVAGITGVQGCGKTTLLMSLIDYIPASFTLRIVEMAFELHLRKLYPDRNIVTFKETDRISGQEGLDLQKKTDGTVSIIGEVATAKVASWMIESGQTGSIFTLFTHHAKTTKSLVNTLRNSLLSDGNFQSEQAAKQQVAQVVRFDIHMARDKNGHRYIERITELALKKSEKKVYKERVLCIYENGCYYATGQISKRTLSEMRRFLTEAERRCMDEELCLSTAAQ